MSGEGDGEEGARARRLIPGLDGTAMERHEILGERQADTCAFVVQGVGLIVVVEDLLGIAFRNARTGVADTHYIIIARMREGDADVSPVGGELEGIAHDVVEYAFELGLVGHGLEGLASRLVREDDMTFVGQGLERVGPCRKGGVEVDGLQVERHLAALRLAEVEYLIHQTTQHTDVLLGKLQKLPGSGVLQACVFAKLLDGCRNERERRAEVVTHVGEEVHLGIVGLFEFAGEGEQLIALLLEGGTLAGKALAGAAAGAIEEVERQHEDQGEQQQGTQGTRQGPFEALLLPIVIQTVAQLMKVSGLLVDGPLHAAGEQRLFATGYQMAFEQGLTFVGLTCEDLDGCLHDDVATRGIGGRSIQIALFDSFDTLTFAHHAIDTHEMDVASGLEFASLLLGRTCHPVAVGGNDIHIGIAGEQGVYHRGGFIAHPVRIDCSQQFPFGMWLEFFDETPMTHLSRCGVHVARKFEDVSSLLRQAQGIAGNKAACAFVVTTHESRIFVTAHTTIEDHDGNARIVSLRDGRSDGFGFEGRNDEQIDSLLDEVSDIVNLALDAVVGRTQFHSDAIVKQQFALHLGILFLTPGPLGTLRHTDAVLRLPRR